MGEDRRSYPRACRALDVTLDASGRQGRGKTVNLSPYGAKVALSGESVSLAPGMNIGLRLTLPDGYLFLTAMVVRTDPDGVALNFDSLEARQFQRLKDFVDSLLAQEWREILTELQGGSPVPATVPSADGDVTPYVLENSPVPATVPSADADVTPSELPQSPPSESMAAQANVTAGQSSVFARRRSGATPPKPSGISSEDNSETDRLRELLSRRGLGDLQLPEGPLTRPWREFFERLEAQEKQG